jgi:hypothetical protein
MLGGLAAVQAGLAGQFLGHGEREPWRSLVAEVAALRRPDDLFLSIDTLTGCVLDYYGAPVIASSARRQLDLGPDGVFQGFEHVDLGCNRAAPIDTAGLREALASGSRLWFLTRGAKTVADLETVIDRLRNVSVVGLRREGGPDLLAVRLDPIR